MAEPKSKKLTVEVLPQPALRAVFANKYTLERDGDHIIFTFSFESEASGVVTNAAAASVSIHDIRGQLDSWKKYIQQLTDLNDAAMTFSGKLKGAYPLEVVEAANIVQLCRLDKMAEITFSLFVLHDLIIRRPSQGALPAQPRLTVRCNLALQVDMLFRLLEMLEEQEPEEEIA